MTELDFINKKALEKAKMNMAICLGLKENKTQDEIAEDLKISDSTVRKVKCKHCPDWGIPRFGNHR